MMMVVVMCRIIVEIIRKIVDMIVVVDIIGGSDIVSIETIVILADVIAIRSSKIAIIRTKG